MKRKLQVCLAWVLVLTFALPMLVFANPLDAVPQRVEDGVVFVPFRYAAYAHGFDVVWDGETGLTFLLPPYGEAVGFNMREFRREVGGFNEAGRNWIPYDVAAEMFQAVVPEFTELVFPLTEEARDIVLQDFNFLMNTITENTVWARVIEQRLGIAFDAYADMFRTFIEDMTPLPIHVFDEALFLAHFPLQPGNDARSLAANYLFALLAFEFSPPLMSIGHLEPRMREAYVAQLTSFARVAHHEEMNHWFVHTRDVFLHPSAVWLYGAVDIDLYAEEHVLPQVPGNVITDVLVPEEVAFLRINSFMTDSTYDDLVILPFLDEIRDFEHLIIDLRSNFGGTLYYFPQLIMRILGEPMEIESFEFFTGGAVARTNINALLQMTDEAELLNAAAFVRERGMAQFNAADLARFAYVSFGNVTFEPAEDSIGFEGKIWLLVDGMTMSAAVMAAEMAILSGFATVVGENTSGVMAVTHAYVALPNTGIIWRMDIGHKVDAYGRSLEIYGLAPNVRNFAGMDALETVLALIAE